MVTCSELLSPPLSKLVFVHVAKVDRCAAEPPSDALIGICWDTVVELTVTLYVITVDSLRVALCVVLFRVSVMYVTTGTAVKFSVDGFRPSKSVTRMTGEQRAYSFTST